MKGFLLLKHPKSRKMILENGKDYILDNAKLVLNQKAELVLVSTSITLMRVESEAEGSLEFLELRQQDAAHEDDWDPNSRLEQLADQRSKAQFATLSYVVQDPN